ncbi:thioredoxin family protein [Flavobacterium sp.]|uniref:thioredoxin family protein n=1 Tax=Flavobacterium sp. TaxID=239 RepID=UPI0008B25B8F|nr:thioredoxin family protein [Flavobacterium sp.]OGS65401.1 MAG: thioredoxin [Flavobacteria bacterium GWA2_35_26]HCF03709.1 thioredoxin family protein [Flavobacterium sp.]
MKIVIAQALFNSHSYLEYRKLMADLLKDGKSTAVEQTQERTHYSELNESRMRRLDKTMRITDENGAKLKALTKRYIWLVLSESWCGDAAQILPILHKMEVESNGKIEMKLVLRDENETLMNHFLTNKSKAIPKLIIIHKETGSVVSDWGPRPQGAVNLIEAYKTEFGSIDETAKANLQLWYLHDKGVSTQNEIILLLQNLE